MLVLVLEELIKPQSTSLACEEALRLLGHLKTQILSSSCKAVALVLNCGFEFRRPTCICDLSGYAQLLAEFRLHHGLPHVRSNALSERQWHAMRSAAGCCLSLRAV